MAENPRGGRNGRWEPTSMLMMLAVSRSSPWPPHSTSLSLAFLICKLKITLIPTSLVVIGIRKEIRTVRSFALCLAHHKCPVKIRRQIAGSRYPLYLDITCFLRLVSNSSSPLVDASEVAINGQQRLFRETILCWFIQILFRWRERGVETNLKPGSLLHSKSVSG